MFILIETFQSHTDMGNRVLGVFDKVKPARQAMGAAQRRFYRGITRSDYDRYKYKTGGVGTNMAWADVVCADDTFGHTWTVLDTSVQHSTLSRYLG